MNPAPRSPSQRWHVDPLVVGIACGFASALCYTATNVFLRQVAETRNPAWVSCVKSLPVVLVATLVLLRRYSHGQTVLPDRRVLGLLIGTGFLVQIAGNVPNQWALGEVGLAITVPLTLGTLITAGVLMGRIFLGEPITFRAVAALGVLMVSIIVLSVGAERADSGTAARTEGSVALGILAACVSGLAYSTSHVTIRRTTTGATPMATSLGVIAATGTVTLGVATLATVGTDEILATTADELTSMLLAGVCNAAAFFALGRSLQLLSMTYVNAFNASQAAMSAIAGVLIFGEAITPTLSLGVLLTVVGLILMRGPSRRQEELAVPVEPVTSDV